MATSISDRELQSYIEKTAKRVVRTVDTKTLKAKIKSSTRQTDKVVSKAKNIKPKDTTGTLEELELMPDMNVSVYKSTNIPKSRISIVKDDEFFFPIAVGRNPKVDKSIAKHKVKKLSVEDRTSKFTELEDEVVSDIKKRIAIKAKAKLDAEVSAEAEETERLELEAARQRKINMRAKVRKIVKSEEAEQRMEIKEDIEEDLGIKKTKKTQLAVVDISGESTILDDYPGENSKSSAKKTRRLQEAEDDEDSLLTEDYPLKGIDKTALKSIESMFGQRSDSIIELLDVGNSDGALSLIMKTLLSTLVDTMPAVEGHVRRSGGQKGVYQLTQLSSQLRETCADIQAYRDRSNLGNKVVERYLRPAFLDIAVQVTRTWIELEAGAASRMSKEDMEKYQEDYLVPMKRGIADYLMKQYEDVSSSLVQSLN